MEANESATNSRSFPHPQFGAIDSPFPVKKNKMKESQNSERMEITAQNCAYFVIRRIDTDSEAETKGNGIKSEEDREIAEELSSGGEGITNEGRTVQDSEMAMNQDTEEEGDEEDDEWVFSRVPAKVLAYEERDTKAKKSLQYGPKDTKETQTDKSSEKGDSKACGRVFEALKLNATVADVGTKEKNARIKRWLSQGGAKGEESAESQEEQASKRYPIDSCDASGEYTSSGESSEVESQSSGELDGSVATCRKSSAVAAVALATAGWNSKVSPLSTQELGISTLSLTPTDGDITPVAESRAFPGSSVNLSPTGKPVLRSKRRKGKVSSHHQRSPKSEQKRRPWSICVSGPSHLVAMSSNRSGIHPAPIPGSPYSASPTPNSPHHTQMHGTRSTSESAIHCLAYSSSSCSTGLDDIGSNPGRAGTGSDGFTPTRGSVDGEGVGSGAGSTSTGSLKRKKVRTRRRALGQRSESGNSDSVQGELTPMVRRGSRSSSKGMSPGSKGSISQSTSSDYSSSNMVADDTKDEMDEEGIIGHCKEIWKRSGMGQVPSPEEEDEDFENEEGEKLGSLQTEETSSYSEQAWDNYQVCLSEGGDYSSDDDKPAKEQLLLRLMEFGDDYRNHFDSQSDGGSSLARQPPTPCSTLDSFPGDGMRSLPRSHSPTPPSPGSSSRTGSGRRKRQGSLLCNGLSRVRPFAEVTPSSKLPPHFPLTSQGPASLGPIVNLIDDVRTCNPITALDSDSDLEEVNHFLRESRAQVLYTEGVMDKALGGSLSPLSTPGKFPPPADYAEIAATCKENIKCLRALLRSMNGMEGQEEATLLTPRDFWETKDLVNRWEMLESRAEECHLVRMLRQEIAALRDAMVAPSTGKIRNGRVEDLQNRKELDRRIQEVKAEIAALFELKNELLEVNVSVNRFLTGAAQPVQCPSFTTAGVAPTTNCVSQGAPTLNAAGQENPESAAGRVDFAFLKDDVAELYREWDDSLSRLNTELAALQRASRTWTELEEGLATLGSALNSDRNALTTLSTAVAVARSPNKQQSSMASQVTSGEKAIQTPALLAASVRELARVLSEEKGAVKTSSMGPRGDKEYDEWEISDFMEETDLNGDSHMNFKNSIDPLGSLSDSGISDSGSEGLGMCERGRRLAALRKLARVLAATLGPNSAPLAALKQRMDEAQKELRSLQRTCRDLVVCTAMLCSASQGRGGIIEENSSEGLGFGKNNSAHDGLLNNNRLGALPSLDDERLNRLSLLSEEMSVEAKNGNLKKLKSVNGGGGGGGGGEGGGDFGSKKKGRGKGRKHWLWRALCCAMPFQLAVVLLLYAAYFLEPHCCSAINNLSFSLSPQLHYVRGPPPT